MVAAVLSVPVLAIVLALGISARTAPGGAVPASAPPSAGVIGSGPILGGPTPVASSSPTASPIATRPKAWVSEARILLEADSELLAIRDRLSRIVGDRPSNSSEIAKQLRAMNPTLTRTLSLLGSMESNGAPADLVADVRAAHTGALEASLDTLTASPANTAAYASGAKDVISFLRQLEVQMARIKTAAGLPPDPSP